MSYGIRFLILLSGFFLFVLVFELVRRKRFREELSLIWFLVAFAVMAASVGDLIFDRFATTLGIGYPPALYFAWIVLCLIVTLLYYSVIISDIKSKLKELSQKIALLEYELKTEREKSRGSD